MRIPVDPPRRPTHPAPAPRRRPDRDTDTHADTDGGARRGGRRGVLWRYRWQLTPIAVASGAWTMSAVTHIWAPAAAFTAATAVVTLVGLHRFQLRGEELLYGRLVVAGGTGWMTAAALLGPTRPGVMAAWVLLTAAAGVPWWRHRRIRGRIRVDRTIEAWPEWTDRAQMPGVRVVHATVGRVADRLRLELQRGRQDAEQLVGALHRYASVRGIPLWRLRADTSITRTDPGLVDLLITHTDPWRTDAGDPIDLPHPAVEDPRAWASTARSVCNPIAYGVSDDGTPAELLLRNKAGGRVIAVAAMKGAGKTVLLRDLLAAAVTMVDADVVVIDHKERGKASAPWAAGLYARATTPQQAVALLSRLIEDIGARGADSPDPVLQPTEQRRAVVLIVDEYGALVAADPRIGDLVETYARTSRSASASLVLADQHVDSHAWSGALRGQIDEVLVGRMQSRRAVRQILPGTLDVDPSEFDEDMRGLVVQRAGKAGAAMLRRAWHLEDPDHVAGILAHVGQRPVAAYADTAELDLQPRTCEPGQPRGPRAAALHASLDHTLNDAAAAATAPRGADLTVDQLRQIAQTTPLPEPTDDERAIDTRIITEIRAAPTGGVSMGDLVDRLGVPRSTVQARCSTLRRQGVLHTDPPRGRHARWHITHSDSGAMSNA